MPRVPQVMLTLSPDGHIVAEYPTPNGLRRNVEIGEGEEGIATIRRILSAQLSQRPATIGLDAKPTQAQVRHWEQHLASACPDSECIWCMAAELGIDTTEAAYKRARASLRKQRKAPTARNATPYHYAGDGTVKVYQAAKPASTARRIMTPDMLAELFDESPAEPSDTLNELLGEE